LLHQAIIVIVLVGCRYPGFNAEFFKDVAAFFYAAFSNSSFGSSGLRTMISGQFQSRVSPLQRDGLAAFA